MECLAKQADSYVALVRLDAYYRFVTDENAKLRRYLFDSNVRDYWGESRVNEEIAETLGDMASPEFWWLNNGVTLLATAATMVGKVLQLQDIQIVNGLQTTETIFRHFSSGANTGADRGLLVKVIVSSDIAVRDRIIRATNNQAPVRPASLHATDNVQRNIEEALERHGWYYERRTNYYRYVGKPRSRFVTPGYLAVGYVALAMKNPAAAAQPTLRTLLLTDASAYASVFSPDVPLAVWVTITEVLKAVEAGLQQRSPESLRDSFGNVPRSRNIVAFLCVSRILGRYSYGLDDLSTFDAGHLRPQMISQMAQFVRSLLGERRARVYRTESFVNECCRRAGLEYGIANPEAVNQRRFSWNELHPQADYKPEYLQFLQEVDKLLPPPPWTGSTVQRIATQLNTSNTRIKVAIQRLVSGRGGAKRVAATGASEHRPSTTKSADPIDE